MSSPNENLSPDVPSGPIVSLSYRVSSEHRSELLSFLKETVPFYEQPGGIKIGLYENIDEPGSFLELVAYDSEAQYEADQLRVEHDKKMQQVLEKWHQFIDGPLEVRRMRPVPLDGSGV